MSLRKATWPTASNPAHTSCTPSAPRHNPMALSRIVHPPQDSRMRHHSMSSHHESVSQESDPHNLHHTSYAYSAANTAYSPTLTKVEENARYELFGRTRDREETWSDSSLSSPSRSKADFSSNNKYSYPQYRDDNRYSHGIAYSSDVKGKDVVFSANDHCRKTTSGFGSFKKGRYCCTYRDYATNALCGVWEAGYTTWYDLARHADSEHGPEEVELIDQGRLTFEDAQWVKSEDQRTAIKNTIGGMVCHACGTTFASNRFDSIERHIRSGACERVQEKQRTKHNGAPVHRKKGGKTAADHTRR